MKFAIVGVIVLAALAGAGYYWFEYIRPNPYPEAYSPAIKAAQHMKFLVALQDDFLLAAQAGQIPGVKQGRYGTLREVAANSKMNLGYAWKSETSAELHDYCFAVFLPDPPENSSVWAAAAWPSAPDKQGTWPAFFIDQGKGLYISIRPPGKPPMLAEMYSGKPFVSPINHNLWRLQRDEPIR